MYAFFAYSVGASAAEDLTSATFERVVRSWHRFDPERGSERTWILAIARNQCRSVRQRPLPAQVEAVPVLADCRLPDAQASEGRLSVEQLKEWLRPLGAREREIIALRYGADLEGVEIARMLDLTPANVHQILSRSLRRLRELANARGAADQRQRSTGRSTGSSR